MRSDPPAAARRSALAAAVALALLAGTPAAAATARIEDDYARALAEARRRDVPVLVDVWAPW